jgi:hypothetical protein
MNLISFVDELVKLGAVRPLIRKLAADGDSEAVDIPQGMMSSEPVPDSDRVHPAEAATRLPATAHLEPEIETGHLGKVTEPKHPIDRDKYNRAYRDRR